MAGSELTNLLDALCEDRLTPEDASRLESLVRGDRQNRMQYITYMYLDAALRWDGPSDVSSLAEPRLSEVGPADSDLPETSLAVNTSVPIFPSTVLAGPAVSNITAGWLTAYLIATVIFVFGLTIAAVTQISTPASIAVQSEGLRSETLRANTPAKNQVVGRITGMVECVWANSRQENLKAGIRNLKSPIALGDRFRIQSGWLEITYDTGAKVILQGPVTYEVESASGGYLAVGKLTARLEKGNRKLPSPACGRGGGGEGGLNQNDGLHSAASLFAVRTPTAVVTDLGTEFGIEVSKDGVTRSHVFRGVVEVKTISLNGKPQETVRLTADESVQVERVRADQPAKIVRVATESTVFVRSEQFRAAKEEPSLKPYRQWQAYSEKLRRDPSLVAYYDFQQKPGSPKVLANVAENGRGAFDGVIANARWTTGRMPGKDAILFNGSQDYVRINLPQKVDNLTLAMWVCVERLANGLNGLLMSDGWGKDGMTHWSLVYSGQIGFDVHDSSGRNFGFSSSPFFDEAGRLHRWTHLVVVYDQVDKCARFYADGRSLGQADVQQPALVCIGSARIGQWNHANHHITDNRDFHGRIDELMIFGRVLSGEEILEMYRAGGGTEHRASP